MHARAINVKKVYIPCKRCYTYLGQRQEDCGFDSERGIPLTHPHTIIRYAEGKGGKFHLRFGQGDQDR